MNKMKQEQQSNLITALHEKDGVKHNKNSMTLTPLVLDSLRLGGAQMSTKSPPPHLIQVNFNHINSKTSKNKNIVSGTLYNNNLIPRKSRRSNHKLHKEDS